MMERRIGQHHAQIRVPRRRGFGDIAGGGACFAALLLPAQQYNRPRRRNKQLALGGGDVAQAFGVFDARNHDRQRFVVALFALAQPGDRRRIRRVAHEVIAAQPLERADLCGPQLVPESAHPIVRFNRFAAACQ